MVHKNLLLPPIISFMHNGITRIYATARSLHMKVLIYSDEGVEKIPLDHTTDLLSSLGGHTVRHITAADIIKGNIPSATDLFVMPGGADRFYAEKLNGAGNGVLRDFVEDGGTYLGICAGGYYGGASLIFGAGTDIEVSDTRELAFFPGCVKGPAFPGFVYNSHEGAHAAQISGVLCDTPLPIYFNGGGYFDKATSFDNVEVLAQFSELKDSPAAVVSCDVGKGKAMLSSVHFEYNPEKLDKKDPHLQRILPALRQFNAQRLQFALRILRLCAK
jgi:glutamine amidotransferase-like uncharacterized protein